MKKTLLALIMAVAVTSAYAQQWAPVGDNIKTSWAEQIDPSNPLPEYPRPQMVRADWMNLNGLWDYAITDASAESFVSEGKILVPFAVESSLSGVGRKITKENALWYEKTFTLPKKWKGKNVLLHFGAVDWQADVYVNGALVGGHKGGFDPFSFDINWNDFAKTGVYDGIARMTTEGTYKYDATSDIKVGEGFMVMTNGTSPSLTYGTRAYNESYDNISVVASGVEGSDNVVLHFNGEENEGFPKLDNINENAANVFVLRNGNRYGICSYDEDVTEIPLYFDAKEMGSYSLAIETEGRFDNVYL